MKCCHSVQEGGECSEGHLTQVCVRWIRILKVSMGWCHKASETVLGVPVPANGGLDYSSNDEMGRK